MIKLFKILSTYIILVVMCNFSYASYETHICLYNSTSTQKYIKVTNINNYDWEGVDRPDENFNNIYINPGETICRREEVIRNMYSDNLPEFNFLINGLSVKVYHNHNYYARFWFTDSYSLLYGTPKFYASNSERMGKVTTCKEGFDNCMKFSIIDPLINQEKYKGSYLHSC